MTRRAAFLFTTLCVLLAFTACGPILGQLSKTTEGTSLRDVDGSPPAVKPGARLLILSPFPKTKDAFYIVKGEDEQKFADEFNRLDLFRAETLQGKSAATPGEAKALASKSPAALKSELGLAYEPDLLLTGTLLNRKTYVAPMRGVVMSIGWRLVFTDLRNGRSWTVDAESKELAEDTIPRIAEQLARKIAR
jgi:hypothetical protein